MIFQYEDYTFKIRATTFNENSQVHFLIYEKGYDDNSWLEYQNLFSNVRDGIEVTISFNDYSMIEGYSAIGDLLDTPSTEMATYLAAVDEMRLYLINNPMSRAPETI